MSAVTEDDIVIYNSTNGLGGAITEEVITSGVLHNIFDRITPDEALAGKTSYRCIYVRNTATSTLFSALIGLSSNTPSTSSNLFIGLGNSAIGGTEQSITDEETAPISVDFVDSTSTTLSIGDLASTEFKSIWLMRVIDADATAVATDGVSITIQGTTEG